MANKPKTRKRNPQDATLRNVRAVAPRLAKLEGRTAHLEEHFSQQVDALDGLLTRVQALEAAAPPAEPESETSAAPE